MYREYRCSLVLVCALLCLWVPLQSDAVAQLRIVTYNTANGSFTGNDTLPRTGMDIVLEAIGDEVTGGIATPIDALILQEQAHPATTTQAFVDLLNGIYGAGTYARSSLLTGPSSDAIHQSLVYNTQSLSLIGETSFGTTGGSAAARQTGRYQLRPVGYDSSADFYIYNDHYKAGTSCCGSTSDQGRRDFEAQAVRANADALGQGTHAIYAGDFNIWSSSEAMYQTLLASGNGQAFDPISSPGTWHKNFGSASLHTQSPHDGSDGLVQGGLDDRFDFQLVTGELLDSEGLSYISGSYHAFGNNGTTYDVPVNNAGNTYPLTNAQLDALAHVSDHLPVVADYQLPASMMASLGTVPANVSQGAVVNIDVMVENIANVLTTNGADELDYSISVSGALSGSAGGTDFALGGGNTHQLLLNTSTLGPQSGTVTVTTSSQGAANTLFNLPVNFMVGEGGGGPVFGVIAKDDFDSTLNRNSFFQSPLPGAFASPADGFETYQVGVSGTIPNDLIDESLDGNPGDDHGVIDTSSKADAWFGVADVNNNDNPGGTATATWEFDVTGATDLQVSIDMGAMGNFEAGDDLYDWTYAFDGGSALALFTSSVDEAMDATYTLADGDMIVMDDPLFTTNTASQTVQLSNSLQTITSQLVGSGSTLTLQLTTTTNGSDEAYVFDNIIIEGFTGGSFLEADFNEDGNVDALDLAQWQGDYGLNDESDADGDGDSDGNDFLVWQTQNGQTTLLTATSKAIPEPPTATLLLLAVIVNLRATGWPRRVGRAV